jgi:outer membrane protein OmpA-like peptidoglycan-associated protein
MPQPNSEVSACTGSLCSPRFFFTSFIFGTFADIPDWIHRLPFTDDAFWGVGEASSAEEAQMLAKQEILMQMSSHVQAVITMEIGTGGGEQKVSEDLDAFFSGNSLRGAELVEDFTEEGTYWALMKYCDDCGKSLLKSALNRFEEAYRYDSKDLFTELTVNENISRGFQVERRLQELRLEDFGEEDILVRFEDMRVIIMIVNFVPYEADLSTSQVQGLSSIGQSLLEELSALDYQSIGIVGHANPTGDIGEEDELIELSRNRAQTLASYLSAAGLTIDSIAWRGGEETIGNSSTLEGKGLNRRVEIVVNFE